MDGKKHPKSSRPCFGNVPALAAPIFKAPRPHRQRLGLSGISVALSCQESLCAQNFQAFRQLWLWGRGLLCSHRMKESNDPGRTRTYNPQLRCLIHWGPLDAPDLSIGPQDHLAWACIHQLLVQPASGLRPTKPGRDDLDIINEVRRR